MHNEEWKSLATNTTLGWATGLDRPDGNSCETISLETKLRNSLLYSSVLKYEFRPFMKFMIFNAYVMIVRTFL